MHDPESVQRLFAQAVQLPPEERRAFVEREAGGQSLRDEVLELLRHHELAGDTIESPASERFGSLLLPPGNRLGEFTILRTLGRGGMGVVYLARDEELGRLAAVKLLSAAASGSELAIGRLRHEAKAVAGLAHPAIVPVYRYGHEQGVHFLAMEFVEGQTFEDWLLEASGGTDPTRVGAGARDGARDAGAPGGMPGRAPTDGSVQGQEGAPLSTNVRPSDGPDDGPDNELDDGPTEPRLLTRDQIREAVAVLVRIGDAIQYAHDNGVIHRDLKPSNILLGADAKAKLTDFGIALVAAEGGLTQTMELIGTPYYMSPEQAGAVSRALDFRTDIFSLGVGLYRVLTSRLPFTGESMSSVLRAICNDAPRNPRAVNPAVDRDLTTICLKALEKDPRERYQSAAHFTADLRSWLRGDPILASRPGLWKRARHLIRGHPLASLAAAALVVIAGLATYALWPVQGARVRLIVETPGTTGARVYTKLLEDPVGGGWGGEYRGRTVLNRLVEPGVHRITVVQDSDRFAQTVRVLDPATTVTVELPLRPADTTGMSAVPGGTYLVGHPTGNGVFELREVRVDPFLVDRTEVSNAQYKRFLDESGRSEMQPESWRGAYRPEWADLPVTSLPHEWMQAYAAWVGKRLPTIEEWEAARIVDGSPRAQVPAGAAERWEEAMDPGEPPKSTGEIYEAIFSAYADLARPVVAPPAERAGTLGLSHMNGNVREATSTREFEPIAGDRGTRTTGGRAVWGKNDIVHAGGSFADDPRDRVVRNTGPSAGFADPLLGFRCVRSVELDTDPKPEHMGKD